MAPNHHSLNLGILKVKIRANFGPLKSKNQAFFRSKNKILDMFWVNGVYFE